MSDHRESMPGVRWRPWTMGELRRSSGAQHLSNPEPRRPQSVDIDSLRRHIWEQAREEGYRSGFEQGRSDGQREGFSSGLEEGHRQGLDEGRRQAVSEFDERLASELTAVIPLVRELNEALVGLADEVGDSLVDLALATGRQLARDALDTDHGTVLAIVRELLHHEPMLQGKPRLWLHPQDLQLAEEYLGDEFRAAGWKLQPDHQLSRGSCRVTSSSGELDATWETRWSTVMDRVRRRAIGQHVDIDEASQP